MRRSISVAGSSPAPAQSSDAANIAISIRSHEAILNAIARGNAAQAESLLFTHVVNSRKRLRRALKQKAAHALKPVREAA